MQCANTEGFVVALLRGLNQLYCEQWEVSLMELSLLETIALATGNEQFEATEIYEC